MNARSIAIGAAGIAGLALVVWWIGTRSTEVGEPASPGSEPPTTPPPVATQEPVEVVEPRLPVPGEIGDPGSDVSIVFDESAEPPRELIEGALRAAVEEHFPRRKLSSDQLGQLTDAVITLRDARAALRELPYSAEEAERRRALVDAIGAATADFEYILELSPGEFSDAVQPGVGVSRDAPGGPVPAPEFLSDHPPPTVD